jgi:hypothetical protein
MKWLVFSYSLPSKFSTNSRVRLWRKLRKLGAISPKTGVHVLPYTEDCLEALKWISLEVEQEYGDALVMKVDQFENLPDDKLIDLFRNERTRDYQEIEVFLKNLETEISISNRKKSPETGSVVSFQKGIKKLRKNIEEVAKVDFFKVCDKNHFMDRLQSLQRSLMMGNMILVIMFSIGTLNTVVLRKMKEEINTIPRKATVEIKRTDGLLN